MKQKSYRHTIVACFIGYISQAVINNFAPLLFLTFQESYGIPLGQITLLVTINFGIQLLTDLVASGYVQRFGYRRCIVAAHILCTLGLASLAFLPEWLGFSGLLSAVVMYAVGGGLLEVLVSPIVEACPTQNKAGIMSLMHSFYCWGTVGTVLVSTGFFVLFGIHNWKWMALLWAALPACNAVYFSRVPLYAVAEETGDRPNYGQLFRQGVFWLMFLLMVCSGACEQAVSQWASTFAEKGLAVNKTTGDLLGVCGFSVLMGLSRVIYGKCSERLPLKPAMVGSALLCIGSYLLIGLSAGHPVLGLVGCVLCGFSVGVFWPGTFSLATVSVKGGGTTMFALLALAGDLGCSTGPTVVGLISGMLGDNLHMGILCAVVFPVLLLAGLLLLKKHRTAAGGALPTGDSGEQ